MRLRHYKSDCKERVNYNNISQSDFKRIRSLKNELFLKYGNFKIMNGHINSEELKKYTSMVDCLFDYENVSLISMCDSIKFTDRDIEEILYLWIMGNYDKTKPLEDAAKFFISMTRLKNFSKAYMLAKKYHFEHNQENTYIELDMAEKENCELKTNISIEHRKIEELTENKIELNSLREFMFNLNNAVEEDLQSPDTNLEELKSIRALIVGGTAKWQQRMKELLPDFNFIAPETLNFDIAILNNVDYVFIYTNYLGHAMYYRVISNLKNNKVVFINATNEERVLSEIKAAIYKK